MKRRQILRHAAGVGAAFIAAPVWAQATGRIVLGQSAATSGPAAALGTQFRLGAMLYFDKVNAKGGINGRTIELQTLDDGYEPDRCVANTKKLIEGGAFALFGYIGTPTSLAALPLATQAKVPFLAPFTGAEALRTPFNRYAFHVRASYFDETAEIVKQSTAIGIKRIGVFHQNDSYGKAGLEGVTRALQPRGLERAGRGTAGRKPVEVAAAENSIPAAKPDAIVLVSAYKSCAAFIRAARQAGFLGTFYNVSFVGTKALADELRQDARGVVVSQVMPFPYASVSPLSGEYLTAGKAALGDKFEPNYSSMEGYVAARTVAEGIRRAGTTVNAESLIGAMESLRDLNLGGFFIDFSPTDHTGSKYVDLTILTSDGHVRR